MYRLAITVDCALVQCIIRGLQRNAHHRCIRVITDVYNITVKLNDLNRVWKWIRRRRVWSAFTVQHLYIACASYGLQAHAFDTT
jgi:hypothetical protein